MSSDYKIGWGHIDRGGGPEESEGGTYAILIVPNRLLSHRHLHHMGRNYPLSMDGASPPTKHHHRHSGCQNFTTISAATIYWAKHRERKDIECIAMEIWQNIFCHKKSSVISIYDSFHSDKDLN